MSLWWVSCRQWTCGVEVRDGMIVRTAPILRRFIGQPFANLRRWGTRLGGYAEQRVKEEENNDRRML